MDEVNKTPSRKVIQITIFKEGHHILALCDDSTIWILRNADTRDQKWWSVLPVPGTKQDLEERELGIYPKKSGEE